MKLELSQKEVMKENSKKPNQKEGKIIEVYKLYRKITERPSKPMKETLEDKIERINPYYIRNRGINYVGE